MQKVKVLLLKPLINKGNAGDVVEVKVHYALHHLIPQGIAVVYDQQTKNQNEAHTKKINAYKAELKSKISALADLLKEQGLTFEKQATDNEMLYDSISERSLAHYLMHEHQISLTATNVLLEEKIEKLGTYTAKFHYEDIDSPFTITVVKKA